jgi:hypothetical protein
MPGDRAMILDDQITVLMYRGHAQSTPTPYACRATPYSASILDRITNIRVQLAFLRLHRTARLRTTEAAREDSLDRPFPFQGTMKIPEVRVYAVQEYRFHGISIQSRLAWMYRRRCSRGHRQAAIR